MGGEILPADDFCDVYAAGAIADDADAFAGISALGVAKIGPEERRIAAAAEAVASDGGVAAGINSNGGRGRGDAGGGGEAAAGRDAAGLRTAGVFSAGECGDGAGAGGGGVRGGQSGGPAVLRCAAGACGRRSGGGGAGEAFDQCVRAGECGRYFDECSGLRVEREGVWAFVTG